MTDGLLDAWADCPICKGTGWDVLGNVDHAKETVPCECRYPSDDMPAEMFDAVLDAAREIAAHWLEGKGEYVYPTRGDIDALVQAVRAYDAARTGEGL